MHIYWINPYFFICSFQKRGDYYIYESLTTSEFYTHYLE